MPVVVRLLLIAGAIGAVAACGSSAQPGTPAPTQLPPVDLQHLYEQAADSYNTAEVPIEQAEYTHCTAGPGEALAPCEAALSNDRQATLSFDNAIRNLPFPAGARHDVTKLLGNDAQLETVLEQAATAPSLSVIQSLANQIFTLLTTTASDAVAVRRDIGLPPPSPAPTPS